MKIIKLDGSTLEFPVTGDKVLADAVDFFDLPDNVSFRTGSGESYSLSTSIDDNTVLYMAPVVKAG